MSGAGRRQAWPEPAPSSGPRLALILAALLAGGCRRPPAPIDPADAAYHAAVLAFARVAGETQDLTFVDDRFDPVLQALDLVPAGGEARAQASALADRIRNGRRQAELREAESQLAAARLEAAPAFQPLPRDAPLPPSSAAIPVPKSAAAAAPAATLTASPASRIEMPSAPPAPGQLPEWYRAKRMVLGDEPQEPASRTDSEPPAAAAGDVGPADKASQPSGAGSARQPPPVDDPRPPAVFGLPGPASHALQGSLDQGP